MKPYSPQPGSRAYSAIFLMRQYAPHPTPIEKLTADLMLTPKSVGRALESAVQAGSVIPQFGKGRRITSYSLPVRQAEHTRTFSIGWPVGYEPVLPALMGCAA